MSHLSRTGRPNWENNMNKEQLIYRVIEQIKKDISEDYFTAIGLLLDCLTPEQLERYLPEEDAA